MADPTIRPARFPDDLDTVRDLLNEYEASLSIKLCFQGFAAELAGLPGDYAAPRGELLLAERDGEALGCIALRALDQERCEMKRLFVRPAGRGTGTGRRLAVAILAAARARGYRAMRLDTLPEMVAAQALYATLGFVDVAPYVANPVAGVRYLECVLGE